MHYGSKQRHVEQGWRLIFAHGSASSWDLIIKLLLYEAIRNVFCNIPRKISWVVSQHPGMKKMPFDNNVCWCSRLQKQLPQHHVSTWRLLNTWPTPHIIFQLFDPVRNIRYQMSKTLNTSGVFRFLPISLAFTIWCHVYFLLFDANKNQSFQWFFCLPITFLVHEAHYWKDSVAY